MNNCSRRNFLYMTGADALAGADSRTSLYGQQEIPAPVPAPSIFPYESRSPVSLVKGDDRRKNITEALLAMDKEIGPAIKGKKYVVIKINNVATNNQLATTHVDALPGILHYLALAFHNTRSATCKYAAQLGVGQFDLSKIDIRGEKPDTLKRVFKLHDGVQQHLDWLKDIMRQG